MEVVKAFNSNDLHTEIIIKGTQEEPLFRANDIATILEISNIRTTINDFDETEKILTKSDTLGGNQQVSFLTEKGLYKVLFRSRNPMAEKFQNWLCEVVKEIRLKDYYKLNEEINNLQTNLQNQKIEYESNLANQKEYEKVVKFTNSEMNKYNSIELTKLRVEERKIELVTSLLPLCKCKDDIMDILNKLASSFSQTNNNNNNTEVNGNDVFQFTSVNSEENIENEEEETHTKTNELKPVESIEQQKEPQSNANSTGPIVQVYHKDDVTKVVYVFDSIMEATRKFKHNDNTASFTAIKKAYQHKIVYLDHRWHFISNRKEKEFDKPRDIGETVVTRERNQGQVVMMNIDKTKILKVFKISKDAAKEILQHPSAMCSAIKFSTPLHNHYWMRWENVDKSIQDEYLALNSLPEKQKNIRGVKINQLDPITKSVIKTFASYTDIQKELHISPKKIKEVIETKENYQGKYIFTLA